VNTIGASEAAICVGCNKWGSEWDLALRLRGLVPRYDDRDDGAQATGRMFERAIANRYCNEANRLVYSGPPLDDPGETRGCLHAHADGFVGKGPDTREIDYLLECKTTRDWHDWGPAGTDIVPPQYLVQVIVQMYCYDLPRCDIAAFSPMSYGWRVYTVHRDLNVEALIVELCTEWYERIVVDEQWPDVDATAACARALGLIHTPRPEKVVVEATDEEVSLIFDALDCRYRAATWNGREQNARNALAASMGERGIWKLKADGMSATYTHGERRKLLVKRTK